VAGSQLGNLQISVFADQEVALFRLFLGPPCSRAGFREKGFRVLSRVLHAIAAVLLQQQQQAPELRLSLTGASSSNIPKDYKLAVNTADNSTMYAFSEGADGGRHGHSA
jgi:hypothetical protein